MLGPTLSIPHGGESVIRSLLGYVFMLPISFIPIIGTPLFLLLQCEYCKSHLNWTWSSKNWLCVLNSCVARRLGIWNHARYYQLKQFSRQNRQRFIRHNQGAYIRYAIKIWIVCCLVKVARVNNQTNITQVMALHVLDLTLFHSAISCLQLPTLLAQLFGQLTLRSKVQSLSIRHLKNKTWMFRTRW